MPLPTARQVAEFGQSLLTLPAPRGGRTVWESGDIVSDNGVAHVLSSLKSAVSGEEVIGQYIGEFEITCATGVTAAAGADAFYDEANRTVVTATGAGIIYLGTFEKAKTSGQLFATVRLNGNYLRTGGIVQTIRRRVTIAEINAGLTLLPAVAGFKYRLIDATLIAVGGAAGAATAVTISGTQSTVQALLSVAIAALAQSAVVKPNSANVTVLANGASFVQNDANTGITIEKTGSALTTATHIDVILSYELAA